MRQHKYPYRSPIAAVLAVCMVILSACAGGPTNQTTASNDTLRISVFGAGAGSLPLNMDMNAFQGRSRGNLENVYEPLVYPYRDTFEIRGVLAEKWTVSADGTTYRFDLRKGVKFHDGTPFEAEAVKLSWDLFKKIGKSDMLTILNTVKEVRVIDPSTVEFVVDPAGYPFLARLPGLSIQSAKAIKEHDTDAAWWGSNAVGTGPYKLDEFIPKDRMALSRNESWWGPKPYFAKVVFLDIPEASTQSLMVQKGDVDIAYNVPAATLPDLQKNSSLQILNVKGDRVLNIKMNVNRPPLNNKAVRQALAYAFDYNAIVQARQFEVAATEGPVPSQYVGGWLPPELINKQDLDKAKALLAQAGYKPGDISIDFNFSKQDAKQQTVGEIMQANFAKIGVNVNLKQIDYAQTLSQLQRFAADPKANLSASDGIDMFATIRGPFVPHVYAYFNGYELGQPNNAYAYSNPAAFSVLNQGHRAGKPEDALNFYKQGISAIVAEQPDLWPYIEKRVVAMRADLQGYYVHPTWFPETHVWTISRKAR